MEKTVKRLLWTAAHSLMDRKDEKENNIPFSLKFITKDGSIISVPKVIGCYSYNHLKGTRRIQLENGNPEASSIAKRIDFTNNITNDKQDYSIPVYGGTENLGYIP